MSATDWYIAGFVSGAAFVPIASLIVYYVCNYIVDRPKKEATNGK